MSDIAIQVEGLGKLYRIGRAERPRDLREAIVHAFTAPLRRLRYSSMPGSEEEFWALKDVSFEIERGEVVGVIGRNGAGKSTLLKVLSRITEPTQGEARIFGRVGSLLEVGTGFHPELTGRENVFLNGAILGMKREEIARRFDEIVAFSEIEKFLDTPVKRYSSGMYVRLAFAVAAHLEPEILIVDEVLAVGDSQFQKKCLGKMGEVARVGRTVLFVSHNMGAINTLTNTCVYLKSGRLEMFDSTPATIKKYYEDTVYAKSQGTASINNFRREKRPDSPVEITSISLAGNGDELPQFRMLSDISILISLQATMPISGANVTVRIKHADTANVTMIFSWDSDFYLSASPGKSQIALHIPRAPFTPGRFLCDVGVNQSTSTAAFDVIIDYPLFEIRNDGEVLHWFDRPWGAVHLSDVTWEVIEKAEGTGRDACPVERLEEGSKASGGDQCERIS